MARKKAAAPKTAAPPASEPDESPAAMPAGEAAVTGYQGMELKFEDGTPSYRATIGRMDLGPEWMQPDPGQHDPDWHLKG
jgi:hypothetical protein